MTTRRSPFRFMLVVVLGLALSGVLGFAPPVAASTEDTAMFYEELAQYGNWVNDEKHGPVWYPRGVEEGWRPYLNGRWNPTQQGYVFETQEPWGWATYHYGNWMPTESHGWVWAPGRTWYPNTVNWRTGDDYVGWAPIPPPNFVPPSSYAPPGGYSSGMGVLDLLTAPFYIFAKAASFLLGFGQPYSPSYSYMDSGILAPPSYAPVVYSRTVIVNNYVMPNYYPAGHLHRGSCFYAWGPPLKYVSRVTRINQALLNDHLRRMNLTRIHHGLPGDAVLSRRPFLRQIVPQALVEGKPLPRVQTVPNVRLAAVHLARPNVGPALKEAPRLTAQIPQAQAGRHEPGQGIPGAALPPRAVEPLTPKMTEQINKLPAHGRIAALPETQRGAAGSTGQVASAAPAAKPGMPVTPPVVQGAAPESKPVPPRVATEEPGRAKPELSQEPRQRQPRRQEMQPRPQEQPPQRQAQWQWQQRQQEMAQRRQQEMQQRQAQWQQQQAQRQQEMQQRRQQEMQQRQQQWQQRQQEIAQRRQQEIQQRQQQHQQKQQQIQQQRQERQQPKEKKKQQQEQQTRLYR